MMPVCWGLHRYITTPLDMNVSILSLPHHQDSQHCINQTSAARMNNFANNNQSSASSSDANPFPPIYDLIKVEDKLREVCDPPPYLQTLSH